MKLTKKKEKDFTEKIRKIKELEQQKKQAETEIDELKGRHQGIYGQKYDFRTRRGYFHGALHRNRNGAFRQQSTQGS